MAHKDERWLNHTGLNLIRIVIGSYFMAVSLDLVVGVDQKVLFLPFGPEQAAELVGSTILFVASIAFMTGTFLRLSALVLALFVFCSSLIQNFLIAEFEDISAFWRDVTLVCAIILNYSNMNRHELRRADLMCRRKASQIRKIRKIHIAGEEVTPRRVTPPALEKHPQPRQVTPPTPEKRLQPCQVAPLAPEKRTQPRTIRTTLELPSFMKSPGPGRILRDDFESNMFANI